MLACSSPEHRLGAVAQGFPFGLGRCCAALRHVLVLAVVSLALPCVAVDLRCDDAAATRLVRVSANVWRVPAARGDADESNGGVIAQLVLVRDGARVWLIGSGPTPAFGATLACAVRRETGHDVTDVVNTRAAPELAMGNIVFVGARVWALPDVIAAMQVRCVQCQERLKARIGAAGASLQPDRIDVPSRPVGAVGAVAASAGTVGGTLGPFAWRALERAPGERVLVLRHRRERIVIAQGLLWAGDVPDLRETHSVTLLASLRALRTDARGARVLGEQGDVSDARAITQHIAYIDALRQAVLPHLIAGEVQGASGTAVALPAFDGLPSYGARHPLNVQRVWRELEPTIFR